VVPMFPEAKRQVVICNRLPINAQHRHDGGVKEQSGRANSMPCD
jgi:hypothetical protein